MLVDRCETFFVFLLLFCCYFRLSSGRLYSERDSIVLLENSTIAEVIYDSPVAWIVEFYSSWCGHCHAFAPTYKRLAEMVQGKSDFYCVAYFTISRR